MVMPALAELSPEQFENLCIFLLKSEISPNVRQTALYGPDGGRDGFLDGPCVTRRYEWSGTWVFQCKHTARGNRQDASRLFSLFEKDFESCLKRYPTTKNYVLLFSSFQSGHYKTGLVDKLTLLKKAAGLRDVNFDWWDGLEIITVLAKYASVSNRFFPSRGRALVRPAESYDDVLLMDARPARDADEAGMLLTSLVNREFPLFSPSNGSLLSTTLFVKGPLRLLQLTKRYLGATENFVSELMERRDTRYPTAAFLVFHAAALVRLNQRLADADRLLNRLSHTLGSDFPELRAFSLNLRSTIYGKTENAEMYERATRECISLSKEHSFEWLAASVAFRYLHKTDWNASEGGRPVEHSIIEDEARLIGSKTPSLSYEEIRHLEGQMNAVLALHYRWAPNEQQKAAQGLAGAARSFAEAPDRSEMVRITVEAALFERTAYRRPMDSLDKLKAAMIERIETGDYARLRYDLLWLSDLYQQSAHLPFAGYCAAAALRLHRKLYADAHVDQNLLKELLKKQQELERHMALRGDTLTEAELSTLQNATDVSSLIWREVL
jgi:hypothetical protein